MSTVVGRRGAVLTAVHTVPGSHLRALERISGVPLGTLRYHLEQLVVTRQVDSEPDRRYRRFYPAEMDIRGRRVWDALRQQQVRALVAALLAGPASQTDLARTLGRSLSTVHQYINRLRSLGLVAPQGSQIALRDASTVRAIMETINLTVLDRLTDGAIGLFDELAP